MSAEPITIQPPGEPRKYTVEEFFAQIPDGQKADLIDGEIFVASPDTPKNHKLASFIEGLLEDFLERRELGSVYGHRVAFVLNNSNAPEPDVAFLTNEHLDREGETRIHGAPDIAVEVVSRDSIDRDYVKKMDLYERAGVSEYWLIDSLRRSAEFYRLREGRYVRVPLERGRYFHSSVLPEFWFDVEWLWANPRPKRFICLEKILAGEPVD